MRAVAVHHDVVVVTSRLWQTTATAIRRGEESVLVDSPHLSDVEIPLISSAGSVPDYRDTLNRLAPLVERVETVIPGHGSPHDRDTALRLLGEDTEYLEALGRGGEVTLPPGRDSTRQRQIHAD